MRENTQTQAVTVVTQVCMFWKEVTSSSLTLMSHSRNWCLWFT